MNWRLELKKISGICDRKMNMLRYYNLKSPISKLNAAGGEECVILGNGPSLKETLSDNLGFLEGKKKLCVNEFSHSDYFDIIKPDFYVFFDPACWSEKASPKNQDDRTKNYEAIKKVQWKMTIFMPIAAKKWNVYKDLPMLNKNIEIVYINNVRVYFNKKLNYFFYKNNLAMPYVQNVLVAGIFLCLNMGFKKIYITGTDHSWHENICVCDDNILYWKDYHFFDKSEISLSPVFKNSEQTETYTMHEILTALSHMFKGYEILEDYSKYMGAKIYNASAKSYIDAFERFDIRTATAKR